MIETQQSSQIQAPLAVVWGFAKDIKSWAKLMPGFQHCDVIDENASQWKLKVGVGALVRTINVAVHVGRWSGPDEVDFTYQLVGDPVRGVGTYRARSVSIEATEIVLSIQVEGEGPMAPMWEAMGKPLLPKFAQAFAEQFKLEVEQAAAENGKPAVGLESSQPRPASVLIRLMRWFRQVFGSGILGRS